MTPSFPKVRVSATPRRFPLFELTEDARLAATPWWGAERRCILPENASSCGPQPDGSTASCHALATAREGIVISVPTLSIAGRLDTRDNGLNLLRLVFAAFVIISHACYVGGFRSEYQLGDLTLGALAVSGFFAISGYLITRSRSRVRLLPYLWRRAVRILPGYWTCLVVTVLGFSVLASTVRGGWSAPDAARYVATKLVFLDTQLSIGSTLRGAHDAQVWNSSLWTLRYEFLAYILVGLLLLWAPARRSAAVFAGLYLATVALSLWTSLRGGPRIVEDMGYLFPSFAAGALVFRFQDRIPATWWLAAISAAAAIAVTSLGLGHALIGLPLAYLCLWLAVALPAAIRRVGQRNDLSYGAYLYGFPVEQLLVLWHADQLGLFGYTALSLIGVIPLAAASWFLVEQPALRLKRLIPPTRADTARQDSAGRPPRQA